MPVGRSKRKHWRLPGLPAGCVVVRLEDVGDGEEPTAIPQAVLDRLLDPLESVAHAQVIEICESLHPGSIRPFRTWSVRERLTWVRRTLSEAFARGALTMVRELPDKTFQPLSIGPTLAGGPHPAWVVANLDINSWSSRGVARAKQPGKQRDVQGAMQLMRRQDVLHGDRIVSGPEDTQFDCGVAVPPGVRKGAPRDPPVLENTPRPAQSGHHALVAGKSARNRMAGVGLAGGACQRRQPGDCPRAHPAASPRAAARSTTSSESCARPDPATAPGFGAQSLRGIERRGVVSIERRFFVSVERRFCVPVERRFLISIEQRFIISVEHRFLVPIERRFVVAV